MANSFPVLPRGGPGTFECDCHCGEECRDGEREREGISGHVSFLLSVE
jgi:hypothetical protein